MHTNRGKCAGRQREKKVPTQSDVDTLEMNHRILEIKQGQTKKVVMNA